MRRGCSEWRARRVSAKKRVWQSRPSGNVRFERFRRLGRLALSLSAVSGWLRTGATSGTFLTYQPASFAHPTLHAFATCMGEPGERRRPHASHRGQRAREPQYRKSHQAGKGRARWESATLPRSVFRWCHTAIAGGFVGMVLRCCNITELQSLARASLWITQIACDESPSA